MIHYNADWSQMRVKVEPHFVKRQPCLPQVHYARMSSRPERARVSGLIIFNFDKAFQALITCTRDHFTIQYTILSRVS